MLSSEEDIDIKTLFLQKPFLLSAMKIFKKKEFKHSRKQPMNVFVEDRFCWRSVWNLARLDKQVDWIDFNLQWVFDFGKTRRCCQYGMSITLVYHVHCITTLTCMKAKCHTRILDKFCFLLSGCHFPFVGMYKYQNGKQYGWPFGEILLLEFEKDAILDNVVLFMNASRNVLRKIIYNPGQLETRKIS